MDVVDSCPGWEPILLMLTKEANASLSPASVFFHSSNAVAEYAQFKELYQNANLITLMFTLNELVSIEGKVSTTKFLLDLTRSIPKECLILVLPLKGPSNIDCRLPDLLYC